MKIVQFFLYAILDIITLLKHCTFSITFSSSICGCCFFFHMTVIYSSPDNVTICRLLEKGGSTHIKCFEWLNPAAY